MLLKRWDGVRRLFVMLALAAALVKAPIAADFLLVVILLAYLLQKRDWKYDALTLFLSAAVRGIISSPNLLEMFIYFELLLITSIPLIAYERKEKAVEAAVKYAFIGSLASAFFLIGMGINYSETGGLGFALPDRISALFIEMALMVEGAVFLAHSWLIDAHSEAPYPVSAILSGAVVGSAVIAISKLPRLSMGWLPALGILLIPVIALSETDVKKMIAYSTVYNTNLAILAISTGGTGVLAGILHVLSHAIAKGGAFTGFGRMIEKDRTRDLEKMKERTDVSLAAAILSLAGAPPLPGFWTKVILAVSLLHTPYLPPFLLSLPLITALYLKLLKKTVYGKMKMNSPEFAAALLASLPFFILWAAKIV